MLDDDNSSSGCAAERVRIEVGVAKQALIEAVRKAGPIAADVQKYLER